MNTHILNAIIIGASALMAFIAVRWVYFRVLKIAKDKNLVDNPDARKLQKTPVPVMGGIAVFFGIIAGVAAAMILNFFFGYGNVYSLMPIILAMVVMLYTGAMDDIIGLTPNSRFVVEILSIIGIIFASGSCINSFHGLWGADTFDWYLAVALTVFACVGIINAINMIDGVNGLSSGLCIACCIVYGCIFISAGDIVNALLAFTVAAALFPFLMHNVFGLHSRMFIGDAGTMMMGVILSWFTICLLSSDSVVASDPKYLNANVIAMALSILSVPVFDTIRVMTMRILKHMSPFHPDKTHLHHIFINVGCSHTITSLLEIGINLAVYGIWLLSYHFEASIGWQLYIVIIAAVILVWGTYFFLFNQVKHHTDTMHKLAYYSISTHLGHKNWWIGLQMLLDRREIVEKKPIEVKVKQPLHVIKFDSDPENYKDQDRKKILEFMKGKAEVYVDDIEKRSGAEKLRIYPLLFEGEMEGYIRVITRSGLGSPEIVTLADDVSF